MAESPKFAHRLNLDGTTDSICFRCIATVATVYDEAELLLYERQHICDPVLVERFDGAKAPSSENMEDSPKLENPKFGEAVTPGILSAIRLGRLSRDGRSNKSDTTT